MADVLSLTPLHVLSSQQSLVYSQGRTVVKTAWVGITETWVPFPALALTGCGLLNELLPPPPYPLKCEGANDRRSHDGILNTTPLSARLGTGDGTTEG